MPSIFFWIISILISSALLQGTPEARVEEYIETSMCGDTTRTVCISKPPTETVQRDFLSLDKAKQVKHAVYALVHMYRSHMRCCHQSYELRSWVRTGELPSKDSIIHPTNDFFLYHFQRHTGYLKNNGGEFLSSGFIMDFLDSNQQFLEFVPIAEDVKVINAVRDSISRGLYWK